MNLRAYVTDSSNYESNNIEISGISKMIIRNGHLLLWSADPNIVNADRFKDKSEIQFHLAPDQPRYRIPLQEIADLHIDHSMVHSVAVAMAVDAPKNNVVTETNDLLEIPSKKIDLAQELESMVNLKIVSQRISNVILEMARKLKTNDLSVFLQKVTKAELWKINGCGVGTINTIADLAEKYGMELQIE